MAYGSLTSFIHALEAAGELKRVDVFTDPVLEISEITDRFSKSGRGREGPLFHQYRHGVSRPDECHGFVPEDVHGTRG